MPRYRIDIEYDGTAYHGWQRQPGAPTIQEAIENALATALRIETGIVGSGRTDAGVHARRQVAHFDGPSDIDPAALAKSLNGLLAPDIGISKVLRTTDSFHARYDAVERCYRYYVSKQTRPLERHTRVRVPARVDFARMNRAAPLLLGQKDFTSFCRTQSETTNRVCRVVQARWVAEDLVDDWYFEIRADRFLHGMVRAIVGTLLQIGLATREEPAIAEILEAMDRRRAGPAARAHGLVLHDVIYEDEAL